MKIEVKDGITPELRRIAAQMKNTRPLMFAAGKAAERAIKDHYKAQPPNTMGFPSQGFWKREGVKKTQLTQFDARTAIVTVDSVEMAHKWFGGKVTPKRAKMLAIPLTAEAYAAGSPRNGVIPDLVRRGSVLGVGAGDAFRALWALVKSVMHKPDPRAFVTLAQIEKPVLETLQAKLEVIIKAGGSA